MLALYFQVQTRSYSVVSPDRICSELGMPDEICGSVKSLKPFYILCNSTSELSRICVNINVPLNNNYMTKKLHTMTDNNSRYIQTAWIHIGCPHTWRQVRIEAVWIYNNGRQAETINETILLFSRHLIH